jgi:hypothetical protein
MSVGDVEKRRRKLKKVKQMVNNPEIKPFIEDLPLETAEEYLLLTKYRKLGEKDKRRILGIADIWSQEKL